jgi:uncharacterized protein YndB with AHSA1/START domain
VTTAAPALSPLRKTLVVPLTQEAAFRRWTAEVGSWWPYRTHSVGEGKVRTVVFEGRVGGQLYEEWHDGTRHVWGTVLEWQPPGLVRYTWHPGMDPSTAQQLELRFEPEGGGTRVTLIHSGWEKLGRLARRARRGYPIGWAYVLALYQGRRGPLVLAINAVGSVLRAVRGTGREARGEKARG